jgi:hypothetical protein
MRPTPLPLTRAGDIDHPSWCSPAHCRADRLGRSHESAPVRVADLTLTVAQSTSDRPTHAVVTIDSCPDDQEIAAVIVRLDDVPALARTLLGLYTK